MWIFRWRTGRLPKHRSQAACHRCCLDTISRLGPSDDDGNYEHLLVIYLEYRADQALLGELQAREVMQFWAADHDTWLYKTVQSEPDVIGGVVKRYGLSPPHP